MISQIQYSQNAVPTFLIPISQTLFRWVFFDWIVVAFMPVAPIFEYIPLEYYRNLNSMVSIWSNKSRQYPQRQSGKKLWSLQIENFSFISILYWKEFCSYFFGSIFCYISIIRTYIHFNDLEMLLTRIELIPIRAKCVSSNKTIWFTL